MTKQLRDVRELRFQDGENRIGITPSSQIGSNSLRQTPQDYLRGPYSVDSQGNVSPIIDDEDTPTIDLEPGVVSPSRSRILSGQFRPPADLREEEDAYLIPPDVYAGSF